LESFAASAAIRAKSLRAAAAEVIAARMVRVLPGYGVAGVLNAEGRAAYRNYLIESKVRNLMESTAAAATTTATSRSSAVLPSSSSSVPLNAVPPADGSAAGGVAAGRPTGELVSLIRAKSVRYDEDDKMIQP
jgi:hypothetical protein